MAADGTELTPPEAVVDRPAPPGGSRSAAVAAPPRGATLQLLPDPAAVATARAFVQEHCRSAEVEAEACDLVVLMTSELVTNAFLHGRSLARLSIATPDVPGRRPGAEGRVVRVEVADDDSRHPVAAAVDHDALDGRGIAIVDLVATAWGVRDEAVGETVWFELDLSP